MAFSVIAIAIGAVLYWAVTSQGNGFRVTTIGVILMIVGAIGFVASATIFATSNRTTRNRDHTFDRSVTDTTGGTTSEHREVHN
jgi:hypothetical protein